MNSVPRWCRTAKHRHGAATVEMALCVPIAFLLFFGIFEFARVGQLANVAAYASYQGCRRSIVTGGTSAHAQTEAQSVLKSQSIPAAKITVTPEVITPQTSVVTVIVAIPMDSAGWITPFFTKGMTISRGCSMTCQGAIPSSVTEPSLSPAVSTAISAPLNIDATAVTSGSTTLGTTGTVSGSSSSIAAGSSKLSSSTSSKLSSSTSSKSTSTSGSTSFSSAGSGTSGSSTSNSSAALLH